MHHPSLSTPATSETWKRWFARRVAPADLLPAAPGARPGDPDSCCRLLADEGRVGPAAAAPRTGMVAWAWRPG